jgi:hypothetical protein
MNPFKSFDRMLSNGFFDDGRARLAAPVGNLVYAIQGVSVSPHANGFRLHDNSF